MYIQVFLPCTLLTLLGAAGGNIVASRSCKTRLAFVVVKQVYVVLRAFIKVHSTWAIRKKYVKILCYNMKASCFINKHEKDNLYLSTISFILFYVSHNIIKSKKSYYTLIRIAYHFNKCSLDISLHIITCEKLLR